MKKLYLLLFILITASRISHAQQAYLDKSFGNHGVVIGSMNNFNEAYGLAIQKDGKIVMSGVDWNYDFNSSQRMFLSRFTEDGRLDKNFGNEGYNVITLPVSGSGFSITLRDVPVLLQPDGRIIIAGGDFYVQRFLADGRPDSSFYGERPYFTGFNRLNDIALQKDRKIIAVGTIGQFDVGGMLIKRFKTNGNYDSSFGVNGRIQIEFFKYESATAFAVQLLDDGSFIVGGQTGSYSRVQMVLVKVDKNGKIDSSFGTNGSVMTKIPDNNEAVYSFINDIKLQPDGKIVAGATVTDAAASRTHATILRYLPDGTLDSSFNRVGYVLDPFPKTDCRAILIDRYGRITGGGGTLSEPYPAKLNRYNTDGSLDQSFSSGSMAKCFILALQNDKILAAGYQQPDTWKRLMAMVRLKSDKPRGETPMPGIFSNIKIFPNPSASYIMIEDNALKGSVITIADRSGKVFITTKAQGNLVQLNVVYLPTGLYAARIEKNGSMISKLFLKE